jgi:hypothetical protein
MLQVAGMLELLTDVAICYSFGALHVYQEEKLAKAVSRAERILYTALHG